jgi:hypothetical protein
LNGRSERALGWYQIVGGFAGLSSSILLIAKTDDGLTVLWLFVPALFFLGLGLAGTLLVRGHRWGRPFSVVAQALQVPKLITGVLSYELYGPMTASIGIEPEQLRLSFGFEVGGGFHFTFGTEPASALIGINLAATLVLWWILKRPAIRPLPASGGLVTR